MGIVDYPIGKLRIKVNLRQLLDGYEPVEVRRHRDLKERGLDIEERHGGGINVSITQANTHQHGRGDNVGGNKIMGDKYS